MTFPWTHSRQGRSAAATADALRRRARAAADEGAHDTSQRLYADAIELWEAAARAHGRAEQGWRIVGLSMYVVLGVVAIALVLWWALPY